MLDFIFITGTSGIGKSTLAQNLFRHYRSTYIEQHMVPEFETRDGTEEMTGELEELTCYENTKAMALCFQRLGFQNIIVSDLDDLRTADIPIDFKGYRYITIKLICSDKEQLKSQMRNRPAGGLIDFELQEKCNMKNMTRPLLVNEHEIDIAGMSAGQVLEKAIFTIDHAVPIVVYNYIKPDPSLFYSWVVKNGLR